MATSPIYKTSNEAGTQARRRGQAIRSGDYQVGDFAKQSFGEDYQVGDLARQELGKDYYVGKLADEAKRSGIASPSSSRRGIAPSKSGVSAPTKSREAILAEYGLDPNAPAVPKPIQEESSPSGFSTFVDNIVPDLKSGGVGMVRGLYEIGNLMSGGKLDQEIKDKTGQSGTEFWSKQQQDIRKDYTPARQALNKELEDTKGFIDSFKFIVTNPTLAGGMAMQMVPQLATIAGATRVVAAKTLAWGLEAGLTREAAVQAAATNASRTVLGLNSVMEGGMAGSDTRSHIMSMKEEELLKSPQYQDLLNSGLSPDLARQKLANDASMISTALAASISAIATKATGAGKLEAYVLGGAAARAEREIGKRVGMAVAAKEVGFGLAKETAEETLQEGGSQFAQNVGIQQTAEPDRSLMEGVPEAAGAGGALGLVAGAGFGGGKAILQKGTEVVAAAMPTPAQAESYTGPQGGQLSAVEMSTAVGSPAFMAYQWSVADDATRAQLQAANPNLDLEQLSRDTNLINDGKRISESAPGFVSSFLNGLPSFDLDAARAEAAGTTNIPGAPSMDRAKTLSDLGMQEAEAGVTSTQPSLATDEEATGTTDTGVRQIGDMSTEEIGLRLNGYKRRAQNLERLPENYRREQAELSVQEMVDQGFPETVARGVFSNLLGPSLETLLQEGGYTGAGEATGDVQQFGDAGIQTDTQTQQEGASAEPVPIVTENGEYRMSDGSMTAEQFAQNLSNWDNQRGGPGSSTPEDYVVREVTGPLKRVADAFGVKIFGWDYVGTGKDIPALRQGISMGGGVIGLNTGRTSQNGEFVVFGHELFHELARRDPLSAKVLMDLIEEYLDSDITTDLKAKLREVGYKEDVLREEIVADVLGVLFTEPSFWKGMARNQPTLLEKIIDIIDQMIQRMSNLGVRERMVKSAIKDLYQVRGQMQAFLNYAIEQQSKGTSIEDNIALNATQAEALQNVRTLLGQGKRSDAAAAFKAANLWKETGLNFNEVEAQELAKAAEPTPPPATAVEEAEVPMRRAQEDIDAENAKATYIEVVDLLRRGQTAQAAKAFKAGNLAAYGENFVDLSKQIAEESKKRVSEATFKTEEQKRLSLKSKKTVFERRVGKVLSGVTKRVEEAISQRKGLAIANYKAARQAQAERRADELVGEAPPKSQFTDDAGMVMKLLAEVGALGQEAYVESQARQNSAEEARAESDRLAEENATIYNNRVAALLYNADRGLDQLTKIRQEMAAVGYSPTEIEAIVAKAESDLKSLRDGELKALAEEQLRDAKNLVRGETVSKAEPEEYPGFNEVQAELDLNDEQRRNALALVAAIEGKSDKLDDEGKPIPVAKMSTDDALKAIKDNDIGQMQLYDAMRERGIPIPKSWIDLTGNISINYSLNDWVKGYPSSTMAARDAWFRSLDKVPENLRNATEGELVSFRNWKKTMTQLRNRLKEQGNFDSVENAFPHALPLEYTLNEMRNPNKIEGDRGVMIRMEFDDPVRAWFKDVQYIEQSRPDLAKQLVNEFLTKEEQSAYMEFREREDREARQALEMKMKSPLYSQIDSLRYLSPEVYTDFRNQISRAEEHQLAVIMQAAFEANEIAKAGGNIIIWANEAADQDAAYSVTPDQMSSEEIYKAGLYTTPNDSIRFKIGTNSGVLPAVNTIESTTEMFRTWKDAPAHTVVQNPNQLPDDVRARILNRFNATGFKAATDPKTGHLYLFSDFLEGDTDTQFAVFNEIYSNWGVRGFMGDAMNTFLENQYRLNQKTRQAADALIARAEAMGAKLDKLDATKAVLGDTAIHTVHTKLANWLEKNGFPAVAEWMKSSSNSEVANVLSATREAAGFNGISPIAGIPNDSVPLDDKKKPVEAYAFRDGNITAFARVNPINGQWVVFTMKDGAKSINEGDYTIVTTDDPQVVGNILKQYGQTKWASSRQTLQYIGPESIQRLESWNPDDPMWTRFKRWFIQGMQNKYYSVWQVTQQLAMAGKDISVYDDLVKYEARTGYHIAEYKRKYANNIIKIMRRLGDNNVTKEDVDEFLMARHAKERNEAIKAISTNSAGSGMTDKEANNILKNVANLPENVRQDMERIGQLVDQMSKDKLAYLLQTGRISKYSYEAMARYKHYVNLSGNEETDLDAYDKTVLGTNLFGVGSAGVIRSTGRGTKAIDVLENTMNSYVSALVTGQKNRVLQSLLQMFEMNPDKTFVEVNPMKQMKRVDVGAFNFDNKILKILGTDKDDVKAGKNFLVGLRQRVERGEIDTDDAIAEIAQRIREAEERRAIDPQEAARALRSINEQVVLSSRLSPDGYVTMVDDTRPDKQELVVYVNGKAIKMVFKGRANAFFQAITGQNVQRVPLFEAFGIFNNLFSQMVTTWNPAWIPINVIRDVQTAISNMAADPEVGAELAGKMAKEWRKSASLGTRYQFDLWRQSPDRTMIGTDWANKYADKHPLSPEETQLLKEFFEDGAATFFFDRDGLEAQIKSLDSMGKAKYDTGTIGFLKGMGAAVEIVSMGTELAPRIAVYKTLREAGKSREFAARYAKELTVNFNMKGSWSFMSQLFAFFNPAVQGTARLFKDASGKKFAAVAAVWTALGFLSAMIARGFGDDDDEYEDMNTLDMVPDYKRQTSLTFLPNTAFGSLPIAYGWNFFASLGSYTYDALAGRMPVNVAAGKLVSSGVNAFSPMGSGAESKTWTGTILKTLSPTAVLPVLEIAMNENRFGAPIYKQNNPYSDVEEANSYMHMESSNPISKWFVQRMSEVTQFGAKEGKNPRYTPGLVDLNAGAVDHTIRSYLPGLISTTYDTAGWTINEFMGKEQSRKLYQGLSDLPVVSRFKAKTDHETWDTGASRNVKSVISTEWKKWSAPETTEAEKEEILKKYPNIGQMNDLVKALDNERKTDAQYVADLERQPGIEQKVKIQERNSYILRDRQRNEMLVRQALKFGWRPAVVFKSTPDEAKTLE
jgi:hypothetical protein